MASPDDKIQERIRLLQSEETAIAEQLTTFRKSYFMANAAFAKTIRDLLNYIERSRPASPTVEDRRQHFISVFSRRLNLSMYAIALMEKAFDELKGGRYSRESIRPFQKRLDGFRVTQYNSTMEFDDYQEMLSLIETDVPEFLVSDRLASLRKRLLFFEQGLVSIYMEGFRGTLVMTGKVESEESEETPVLFNA